MALASDFAHNWSLRPSRGACRRIYHDLGPGFCQSAVQRQGARRPGQSLGVAQG